MFILVKNMNLNAKDVQMGVFIWEDLHGELNIAVSSNLLDDKGTAILLLTEAIQAFIMDNVPTLDKVAH
jgi:hypothetical protein